MTIPDANQASPPSPMAATIFPAVGIRSVGRILLSRFSDGDLGYVAVSTAEGAGTRGKVEVPHPSETIIETHA